MDTIKPKRAKLWEYTAASPHCTNLLEHFISADNTKGVQLLICHPDHVSLSCQTNGVCTQHQLRRMLTHLEHLSYYNLEHLEHTDGLDYSDEVNSEAFAKYLAERVPIRIKCYEQPASLRGRSFDDKWVALGWYTYDRNHTIWGAQNALILAPVHSEEGVELKEMFNKRFDELWKRAMPLKDALDGHQDSHNINEHWLAVVSGDYDNLIIPNPAV